MKRKADEERALYIVKPTECIDESRIINDGHEYNRGLRRPCNKKQ